MRLINLLLVICTVTAVLTAGNHIMTYLSLDNNREKVVSIKDPFPGETFTSDKKFPDGKHEEVSVEVYELLLASGFLKSPFVRVDDSSFISRRDLRTTRYATLISKSDTSKAHIVHSSNSIEVPEAYGNFTLITEDPDVLGKSDSNIVLWKGYGDTREIVAWILISLIVGASTVIKFLLSRSNHSYSDRDEDGRYFNPEEDSPSDTEALPKGQTP